jgi:hypothetical protein
MPFYGVNLNLNEVQSGWATANPRWRSDPVYYLMHADEQAQRRGIRRVEGEQQ